MPLSRRQLDWLIILSINATIPAVVIWKRYSGEVSPTTALITALASCVVLNAVVLVSIRSQRKRQGLPISRSLLATAVSFAVVAALVTVMAVRVVPVRNDYLGLALSNKPLSEIQPEQKRLVVELLRRRAANSAEYDRALSEAKSHPLVPALYTPESFASVGVTSSTISTLKKYVEVDIDYGAKQQQALSEFREKMAKVDPGYLKAWDSERLDAEQLQASATELERQWFSGVVALYDFAASHYDELKLNGSPLERADRVKQQFEEQLAANKALYDQWQQQVQELVRRQNESRAQNVPMLQ